ncbi:type II toxin-antitoxin system HicB family antitoxin [Spirosoma montaniterrae]|uniref:Antitoxin HicB n=1 Tax=Spirosoma montaniterrae TaxID=1178516 RepID=A0A1P9WRL8_9BACT|nr:type II toxin-antitoxin system HicB family antitoxin [Spirosoma montaniterrae]AQG78000.1 antitoxin HicB [Spirosoma montaniterrae]
MQQATYRVLLRREPEGLYTAMVPSIPGCVTWGETIEEAIAMAREAAEGCLEVYAEKGISIMDDSETFEYSIYLPSTHLTNQAA